jgi:hypothetical protein
MRPARSVNRTAVRVGEQQQRLALHDPAGVCAVLGHYGLRRVLLDVSRQRFGGHLRQLDGPSR